VKPCRAVLALMLFPASLSAAENWPQFRGPTGQGHSDATGLPTEWSESRGVAWQASIPGQGHSSPVIWGDQVWMTTATEEGRSLRAVCVDKHSGKLVHDVELFRVGALEPKNEINSYASPTPVIEAGRVYASFGTYGNACVDTATGRPVWRHDDLKLDHQEGPGSSPVLHGDLYVVNCDGRDAQYVAALHKDTGELAWRADRTTDFGGRPRDLKKAFSVPLAIEAGGRQQLVSVGAFRVASYDPADGREVWHCDVPGFSNVPRPVFGRGLLFVSTGYMQPELWAIRPDGAAGDASGNVVWKATQGMPAKPSVLLVDDLLLAVSDIGILRCLEATTGKQLWQERLDGTFSASPIYAGGLAYFPGENGVVYVVRPGRAFELVAENELPGRFMASPAVSGDALFLRTDTHLYRVEQ
jgi:outer membrane protein assembly factor BamB